jgi:aspartate aminotransferase-like enzyme
MFGPSALPNEYSHRSVEFHKLYAHTVNLFKQKFNLPEETIVLLCTGSGTLANEIVLYSSKGRPLILTSGGFSDRLRSTVQHHHTTQNNAVPMSVGVQYETGISVLNHMPDVDFSDAVSAFPYHDPVGKVWTTVSFKQLGSITGLSLIIIKDQATMNELFRNTEPSYLSLKKYYDSCLKNETPNTPAVTAIAHFASVLETFDLSEHRRIIDLRYGIIKDLLSTKGIQVTGSEPVLTINTTPEVRNRLQKFNLYGNSGDLQIFTWTGTDAQYENFYKELMKL